MSNEYILCTVHLATENPSLLLVCTLDDACALLRTQYPPGIRNHVQDGTCETICIQIEELTAIKMPPRQDQTSSFQDLFFQAASWLRGKLERMGEPWTELRFKNAPLHSRNDRGLQVREVLTYHDATSNQEHIAKTMLNLYLASACATTRPRAG